MASNIRSGTTISSQNLMAKETDFKDEKGNFDPDKLLQCPFDKNHQIRSSRFPYHLIKCRKNHPKLASQLATCPFNARHLVPKSELTYHTETCEDRVSVDYDSGGSRNGQVPVSTWVNTNMTEDWDKEADDSAAPFVWSPLTVLKENKLEERPTDNYSLAFRVPNTLPWFKP